MNKIIGIIALCVLLGGCAAQKPVTPVTPPPPPPIKVDWTVTAKWNYDFTNFFQCSSTVTKGCVTGFNWGYLQGTTKIVLHSGVPTSACAGTGQPQACSDTVNVQLPVGSLTWWADVIATDNTGAPTSASTTSAVPTTVSLDAATNLTVAKQ